MISVMLFLVPLGNILIANQNISNIGHRAGLVEGVFIEVQNE